MVLALPLRKSLWFVTLLACAPACSVVNTDHCGNQDGHATCLQRDRDTPYCSLCDAANDGCLAEPPADNCLAATGTQSAGDSTTTGLSSTSTVDPTSSTTIDATTAQTTTSIDPTTTTDNTSTSASTSDTTTTTTDTTTGVTTTTGGPVCGNNKVEGDEICDGDDFNDETCKTVAPNKWGGGSLGCNLCMSLNDSKCCVGLDGACGVLVPDAALPCCGGLVCQVDGLNGYKCKSK